MIRVQTSWDGCIHIDRNSSFINPRYTTMLVAVILATMISPLRGFSQSKIRNISTASSSNSRSNMVNTPFPLTQVISDVDDTLKSSGGVKIGDIALGGIDTQYARGEFYPGVFQFMLELSLSSFGEQSITENNSQDLFPPKVAILTARAEEFMFALELKDDSKLGNAFRRTGEECGIQNWGLGPVLYGSVAEWVIQDRKGLRKFTNFERLISQDPTGEIMSYVYVGDTGELDQEAGETMLREYPEVMRAVFLHVVSERPFPAIPPQKLINGRPVVFFRTYVGAAVKACKLGLISEHAVLRVIAAAEAALDSVERSSDKWVDLYHDVSEALSLIRK